MTRFQVLYMLSLGLVLTAWLPTVTQAHDYCGQSQMFATQAEATAAGQTYLDNMHWSYGNQHCSPLNDREFPWNGNDGAISCHGDGSLEKCFFWQSGCEAGDTVDALWTDGTECIQNLEGCEYQPSGPYMCFGDNCNGTLVATGSLCSSGIQSEPMPEGCSFDGTAVVCDCTANPDAPFCPGGETNNPDDCTDNGDGTHTCAPGTGPGPPPDDGSGATPDGGGSDPDGGGSGTPDGSNTGGNEGTGDGDPDTPGDGAGGGPDDSTGTGDGDTDGDGEREIDCNPLSNPDCQYAGSGTSSGNCTTPPQCSGDPVQCTILHQTWQAQCYALKDTGQAYTNWTPISSNNLELMSRNTTEIDVPTSFDTSGFLGGGSCPQFDTADLGVLGAFAIDSQPFCDFATWAGFLVLAFAGLISVRIIAGGM